MHDGASKEAFVLGVILRFKTLDLKWCLVPAGCPTFLQTDSNLAAERPLVQLWVHQSVSTHVLCCLSCSSAEKQAFL